ncbi:MAG TPA: 30S ribosome-binding factor RbfA [Chthonomonas sp.]|jgi:ribosome-binding factor A|uniref:30S ribosome-binding factor RbfA n=1 Tax=Chthonomonas sp. TaxID=2282153 RepID=UPI002B4B1070|nr:30S ribosome-binding factor RbfA [Chthonomonas sp.]HLH81346.1 30S ribosome-binding factor RbfA [Chthonomonas sp.]
MSVRQQRVQEQLLHEISDILHKELRDPRLGFVTLTAAEISRDLRHAKVYVSVLGDEEAQRQCLKALNGAAGLLRGEFARRAHLRVAPELEFRLDNGIERGLQIAELLRSVENDLKPREIETPDGSKEVKGDSSTDS